MNSMQATIKKILPWGAIPFLCFFLIMALRNGVSEIYSINALQAMQDWESVGMAPTVNDIVAVADQLEIARSLANSDPDHHENIARLRLIHSALSSVAPDERRSLLVSALLEIRTAIALRPASPYSWTIYLLIKRDLGEFDSDFRHALRRAVDLGPWEPELLVSLADVGLSAWPKMPAEEQAIIQQIFVRGMKREGELMRGVAQGHRNECARLADADKAPAECQ